MTGSYDYCPSFSKIYAENHILDIPVTRQILSGFPGASVIKIRHYKDVFNRSYQEPAVQKHSMQLILAENSGQLLYPGAPVCQSFGEEHFYYTSLVMGCIFSCDYCYLRGMYPSANIVIFVNTDDYFREIDRVLKEHPVYLCVSYDTDLLAIEHITGYVSKLMDYASERPDLTLEVRTKTASADFFKKKTPLDNVVFAFTLSPEEIASSCEKAAPSPDARIYAVKTAIDRGFPVRLCFDPMIYKKNWETDYKKLTDRIRESVPLHKLRDISIGTFRISQDYLKALRKVEPYSAVVQYPFKNENGYYSYGSEKNRRMTGFLYEELRKELPEEKLFVWS